MADLLYWVWLNTVIAPGTETFAKLHAAFSSPEDIFRADETALRAVLNGRHASAVPALLNHDLRRAYAIVDFIARNDVGVVTYDDPRYPATLREIQTPPVLLYYRGTLPDFDMMFGVAVVGSREHSDYAAAHTFELARDLAVGGATVISGMALGIDGIALAAALSGKAPVIAVIGSGIDVLYPKEHAKLARFIESHGVIMTEYPPGTPPFAANFPKRNRIISALSRAVLVTAGTLHSGALITAGYARKQGKALFALPGSIDDPYCAAPSLLLREGAHAAVCAEDILFAYEHEYPHIINLFRLLEKTDVNMERVLKQAHVVSASKKDRKKRKKTDTASVYSREESREAWTEPMVASLGAEQLREETPNNRILEQMPAYVRDVYSRIPKEEGCLVDSLVTSECPTPQVMVAITKLELLHLVEQVPGGRVVRTH